MISKTTHSYLGNFALARAAWFCIVKDKVKAINAPPFHGFVT